MKDTECYVNKAEVKRKIRVWLDYRTSRQVTDGLLDLIEKLPVTVKGQLEATLESNWVSVKDEMPPEDEAVLAWNKEGFPMIDVWSGKMWGYAWTVDEISHWMPLPQKPESEDDAE